jgi:hypothetical protein
MICFYVRVRKLLLSNRTFNGTTLIHKSSDPVSYDFEIYFFFFPGEFVCLREDVETVSEVLSSEISSASQTLQDF